MQLLMHFVQQTNPMVYKPCYNDDVVQYLIRKPEQLRQKFTILHTYSKQTPSKQNVLVLFLTSKFDNISLSIDAQISQTNNQPISFAIFYNLNSNLIHTDLKVVLLNTTLLQVNYLSHATINNIKIQNVLIDFNLDKVVSLQSINCASANIVNIANILIKTTATCSASFTGLFNQITKLTIKNIELQLNVHAADIYGLVQSVSTLDIKFLTFTGCLLIATKKAFGIADQVQKESTITNINFTLNITAPIVSGFINQIITGQMLTISNVIFNGVVDDNGLLQNHVFLNNGEVTVVTVSGIVGGTWKNLFISGFIDDVNSNFNIFEILELSTIQPVVQANGTKQFTTVCAFDSSSNLNNTVIKMQVSIQNSINSSISSFCDSELYWNITVEGQLTVSTTQQNDMSFSSALVGITTKATLINNISINCHITGIGHVDSAAFVGCSQNQLLIENGLFNGEVVTQGTAAIFVAIVHSNSLTVSFTDSYNTHVFAKIKSNGAAGVVFGIAKINTNILITNLNAQATILLFNEIPPTEIDKFGSIGGLNEGVFSKLSTFSGAYMGIYNDCPCGKGDCGNTIMCEKVTYNISYFTKNSNTIQTTVESNKSFMYALTTGDSTNNMNRSNINFLYITDKKPTSAFGPNVPYFINVHLYNSGMQNNTEYIQWPISAALVGITNSAHTSIINIRMNRVISFTGSQTCYGSIIGIVKRGLYIYNVNITAAQKASQANGLFFAIDSDAKVNATNIHVTGKLDCQSHVGGVVQKQHDNSTLNITDCVISSEMVTRGNAGGVVVYLRDNCKLNMTNVQLNGSLLQPSYSTFFGGVVGNMSINAIFNATNITMSCNMSVNYYTWNASMLIGITSMYAKIYLNGFKISTNPSLACPVKSNHMVLLIVKNFTCL